MNTTVKPSAAAAVKPVETWMLVIASLLVISSALVFVIIIIGSQGTSELFAGFGEDLPALSRIVLGANRYLAVFWLVSLVPYVLLLRTRKAAVGDEGTYYAWVIGGFFLSLLLLGLWVYAMYLPILSLGNPVS